MIKIKKKHFFIGLGIVASIPLLVIIIILLCMSFMFFSMDSSSKDELVENYQLKKEYILKLKDSYEHIVPEDYHVYIECKDDNNIDLWVFEKVDTLSKESICLFQEWDINPFDYVKNPLSSYDSIYCPSKTNDIELIKKRLKWTDSTFIEIKQLLKKANCISIENGNPVEVGYARSGMGKYSYYLFNDSIPNDEIHQWNDSCSYIYYNPKVVLGYSGGAIGSQGFPDPE